MPGRRLSVRIRNELDAKLRREAAASGTRESDVVRAALERYFSTLRQPETCYDLAEKLGLIGCAKRTPRDLSANRKYFNGFGES